MSKDGLQTILDRKSVRDFMDKEVPEGILLSILEAAKSAPSSWNTQPWYFIIIKNKEHLKKLAEQIPYGKFLAKAPMAIAVVVDPEISDLWCIDGTCATENLMIAASYYGLGTCWVAYTDTPEIKRLLDIPLEMKIITITPLGYPTTKSPKKLRKDLKNIVFYEKFGEQYYR